MPLSISKEDNCYVLRSVTGRLFCVVPEDLEEPDFAMKLAALATCLETTYVTAHLAVSDLESPLTVLAAQAVVEAGRIEEHYGSAQRN